jgi:predicted RNase H-like HicB family nuclease
MMGQYFLKYKDAYPIVFCETPSGGYIVDVPDLPVCFSDGKTIEEGVKNVEEAITLHLKGLARDNDPIPKPTQLKNMNLQEYSEDKVVLITTIKAMKANALRRKIAA